MLKYEIGQKVWLVHFNEIIFREITGMHAIINGKSIHRFYNFNAESNQDEHRLFPTKQNLLDHLSNTAEEEG